MPAGSPPGPDNPRPNAPSRGRLPRRRIRTFRRIRLAACGARGHDATRASLTRRFDVEAVNPARRSTASNRRVRTLDNMELPMNRYDPRTPRALFGFAAVALTLATLAISILVPAGLEHDAATPGDVATRVESERSIAAGDAIVTTIDVVAVRHAPIVPVQPVAQSRDARAGFERG